MRLTEQQRHDLVDRNEHEYGLRILGLNFPDAETLKRADEERAMLLADLEDIALRGCKGTKIDMNTLSPGCRKCVEGEWSCLFISGKCNCRCFYCPTAQDEIGVPTTNTIEFSEPEEYVAYLEQFGFSGASISGGEPLLTPERSLAFVKAVKARFGSAMHVWLYTNGTLAQPEIIKALADAGLDEIRFDIGASRYDLKYLSYASGIIPTLTVEIPAVPEDREILKRLLPELRKRGVHHLNLHQLRLTPYNYDRLQPREYRYIHGDKVTVLDSELTALDVVRHSLKEQIGLPVNYCSYPYKNRYQTRANRVRNARFALHSWESLTENGYIRQIVVTGNETDLRRQVERLQAQDGSSRLWNYREDARRLGVHPSLWPELDLASLQILIEYSSALLRPSGTKHGHGLRLDLLPACSVYVEREKHSSYQLADPGQVKLFWQFFLDEQGPALMDIPNEAPWDVLYDFERLRSGLAEYF